MNNRKISNSESLGDITPPDREVELKIQLPERFKHALGVSAVRRLEVAERPKVIDSSDVPGRTGASSYRSPETVVQEINADLAQHDAAKPLIAPGIEVNQEPK